MKTIDQRGVPERGFLPFLLFPRRLFGVPVLIGLGLLGGLMIFTGCATFSRGVLIVIPDAEDALEAEAASEADEALDALRRQVDDLRYALETAAIEQDAMMQGSKRLEEQRAAAVAELERLQQQSVEQEKGMIDASGALQSLELSQQQGWRAEKEVWGQERETLQSEIEALQARLLAVTEGQIQGAALPQEAESDRIGQGGELASVRQATVGQTAGAGHNVGLAEEDRSSRGGWFSWLRRSSSEESEEVVEQVAAAETAVYRVQAGDEINVEVFREPDLSGRFRINQDGMVRHPLMGSLTVAGKSVKEVEEYIVSEMAARYLVDPRVVVTMENAQKSRVVLLGEVQNPGVYPFPVGETMTLLEAIAQAGGFTELASIDRVRLVRSRDGESDSHRIRVSRVLSGREQDVGLEPNDVITVPKVRF